MPKGRCIRPNRPGKVVDRSTAALAAECAARAGSFEAFHDLLFAQPDSIGGKAWTLLALEAGVASRIGTGGGQLS
jgi:superoxide dismutase